MRPKFSTRKKGINMDRFEEITTKCLGCMYDDGLFDWFCDAGLWEDRR